MINLHGRSAKIIFLNYVIFAGMTRIILDPIAAPDDKNETFRESGSGTFFPNIGGDGAYAFFVAFFAYNYPDTYYFWFCSIGTCRASFDLKNALFQIYLKVCT